MHENPCIKRQEQKWDQFRNNSIHNLKKNLIHFIKNNSIPCFKNNSKHEKYLLQSRRTVDTLYAWDY